MEENRTQFVTTKVKYEQLEKKLRRLFKKLDAIGAPYVFTKDKEFTRTVPVFATRDNGTTYKVDETRVECVEFTLDFAPYKVGDYRVGAVLERTVTDNMVYPLEDDIDWRTYSTTPIRCDHCRKNARRNKAVVLIDNQTGDEIMVGTSCLKDFIGYNVYSFATLFDDIQGILLDYTDPFIMDDERSLYKVVVDARTYLAYCINCIERDGYQKESTKYQAFTDMSRHVHLRPEVIKKADEVANFFETYETEDSFEHDTKMLVTDKKPFYDANGFVAYAYMLYQRIQERIKREEERLASTANSKYYGNVGDKIEVVVTGRCVGSYDTQFGTTFIYRFVDDSGNIFVWKTGSVADVVGRELPNGARDVIPVADAGRIRLRGTIKAHNEYRGEKQTILTRCKVLGLA